MMAVRVSMSIIPQNAPGTSIQAVMMDQSTGVAMDSAARGVANSRIRGVRLYAAPPTSVH